MKTVIIEDEKNKDYLIEYYTNKLVLKHKIANRYFVDTYDKCYKYVSKAINHYFDNNLKGSLVVYISCKTKYLNDQLHGFEINNLAIEAKDNEILRDYIKEYYKIAYKLQLQCLTDESDYKIRKVLDEIEKIVDRYFECDSKMPISIYVTNNVACLLYKNNISVSNNKFSQELDNIKDNKELVIEEHVNKLFESFKSVKNNTILPDNVFYSYIKEIIEELTQSYVNKKDTKPIVFYYGPLKNNVLRRINNTELLLVRYLSKHNDFDNEIAEYLLESNRDLINDLVNSNDRKIILKNYVKTDLKNDLIKHIKNNPNLKKYKAVYGMLLNNYLNKITIKESPLDLELLKSGDKDELEHLIELSEKYKLYKNDYVFYDDKEEVDKKVNDIFNQVVDCYANLNSKSNYKKYISTFMRDWLKDYSAVTKKKNYDYYKKNITSTFNNVVSNYINSIKDKEKKERFIKYAKRVLDNYIEKGSYGNYKKYFEAMIINYDDTIQEEIENNYYKRLTK